MSSPADEGLPRHRALCPTVTWRWLAAGGCLVALLAAGSWLERPFQHPTSANQRSAPTASCRLPVYLTGSKIGGFLTVPGYNFTRDRNAPDGSRSYDAVLGKWLPVDPRLVSRDGKWWTYQTPTDPSRSGPSTIHLVDQGGVDRTVWTGDGLAALIGWTDQGAVFVHTSAALHYVVEYWLIQAPFGTLRSLPAIAGDSLGTDASGRWTMRDLPTSPAADSNAPLRWTLSRTDISTGATVTWWDGTIPGLVQLLGFDANEHPVLRIVPDAANHDRLVVLAAPRTETEIVGDAALINLFPSTIVGDQHGIWFGDANGVVWLWTSKNGLQRVAAPPTYAGDQPGFAAIAGPCR